MQKNHRKALSKPVHSSAVLRVRKNIIIYLAFVVIIATLAYVHLFMGKYTVQFSVTDENGALPSSSPLILIYPYSEDLSLPELIWKQEKDGMVCYTPYVHRYLGATGDFVWENALPGMYWMAVNDTLQKIEVPFGLKKRINIQVKAKPDLHTAVVTLKDEKGNPRAGHSFAFNLYGLDEEPMYYDTDHRFTDENGVFLWKEIPPGNHLLSVSDHINHCVREFRVVVCPGSEETLVWEFVY